MAQCKGSLLMLAVKTLRAANLPTVPTPLERYLIERIEILKWYPESDLHALLDLLSRLHPQGQDVGLFEMGKSSAQYHIEKTYRRQFERVGENVLEQLWHAQHDTGHLKDHREGTKRVLELHDFKASSPQFCRSLTGYLGEVLRHLGHKANFEKVECVHKGAARCKWSAN